MFKHNVCLPGNRMVAACSNIGKTCREAPTEIRVKALDAASDLITLEVKQDNGKVGMWSKVVVYYAITLLIEANLPGFMRWPEPYHDLYLTSIHVCTTALPLKCKTQRNLNSVLCMA